MVGKRKRDSAVVSRSTTAEDEETNTTPPIDTNPHDVFRKFFEAQFQPLDLPGDQAKHDEDESEGGTDEEDTEGSESGSEWGGVSEEDDGNNKVEVVEHQALSRKKGDLLDKKARKAFMVRLHYVCNFCPLRL